MRQFSGLLVFGAILALPAAEAAADNAVGINTHIPSADVLDLTADLGVRYIRVDNNWLDQPDPCGAQIGVFQPLEDAVTGAASRGLEVFMTLAYTPACASTGDTLADGPRNDVPDAALYRSYVRQSVAHYRPLGVRHFGLWNEANLEHFFEGIPAQYVSQVVAPGLAGLADGCADAGYSDCLALGPDLAHVGDYDVYLEATLDAMATAGVSFDIFTHHIYQDFTGTVIDGDSFVNALDMRRFSFTRRSLLDVLRDTGLAPPGGPPSIEVWITETGHRAEPPTDAGEMQIQKEHYMKTLDEQLARSWYTATFFYEILDSMDQIDGFGITRADGMGGYTEKPAYDALKDRLANDPGFNGTGTDPDAGPTDPGDPDAGPARPGDPDAGPVDPTSPDGGSGNPGDGDPNGGCAAAGSGSPAALLLLLAALLRRRRRHPRESARIARVSRKRRTGLRRR